eukprot:4347831-Prymnesium_polylepis.1
MSENAQRAGERASWMRARPRTAHKDAGGRAKGGERPLTCTTAASLALVITFPRAVKLPSFGRAAFAAETAAASRFFRCWVTLYRRQRAPTRFAAAVAIASSRQGRPTFRPRLKSEAARSLRLPFSIGLVRARGRLPPSFRNIDSMMSSADVLPSIRMSGQYFFASSGCSLSRHTRELPSSANMYLCGRASSHAALGLGWALGFDMLRNCRLAVGLWFERSEALYR